MMLLLKCVYHGLTIWDLFLDYDIFFRFGILTTDWYFVFIILNVTRQEVSGHVDMCLEYRYRLCFHNFPIGCSDNRLFFSFPFKNIQIQKLLAKTNKKRLTFLFPHKVPSPGTILLHDPFPGSRHHISPHIGAKSPL